MRLNLEIREQKKEPARLVLPGNVGPESLPEEWSVETHQQESKVLTFWDTFEWGLWFGGHLLYSHGGVYHLCTREGGWLDTVVCTEEAECPPCFWEDFKTDPMRAALKGMLGLRGLASVAEGVFSLGLSELRNDEGKIVCRLQWFSVSAGKREEDQLVHTCQVIPLLGYEAEAARIVEFLHQQGARACRKGPLDLLLQHANRKPQRYTLRPGFRLNAETPAREAVGRIVLAMLAIARHNLPGLLNDLDTEFLHDYRICLRKIRSLLSLVKGAYPAEETLRIRKMLGEMARQTNRLRDLDVYLLAREEYLALLPPELRPTLVGMFDDFLAERKVELRRTVSKLRAKSNQLFFSEMKTFFTENTRHEVSPAADLPVGKLVFKSIYKRYRKICRIAAGIGAETPDPVLHQVRIECKKLRYLMEFFSELIPADEEAVMLRLLRRLQGRLGEFNDASVQQKSLLDYGKQKQAGFAVALGLGGLVSVLYQRQQQTRKSIKQALEEFCGGSTAAIFKRTFKVPATNAP